MLNTHVKKVEKKKKCIHKYQIAQDLKSIEGEGYLLVDTKFSKICWMQLSAIRFLVGSGMISLVVPSYYKLIFYC